ncbi:flagellar biosynthetic protein FliO [Erwinia sp. P7711]|uniref:flagellar biosynthetic protein FliO n=1 Tax=Erwinia sp. P7711 TaxID=3141451 RepID=UPI00318AF661
MITPIPSQIEAIPLLNERASTGSMLLNLSGALLVIVVLIVITALLLRRSRWGGWLSDGKNLLTVKYSYALGQRERVVMIEVADRWLLLGVTPGGITLLSEIDKPVGNDADNALNSSFQQMLLRSISKKSGNNS